MHAAKPNLWIQIQCLNTFTELNPLVTIEDAAKNVEVFRYAPSNCIAFQSSYMYIWIQLVLLVYTFKCMYTFLFVCCCCWYCLDILTCTHSFRGEEIMCPRTPIDICDADGKLRCSVHLKSHAERKSWKCNHFNNLAVALSCMTVKINAVRATSIECVKLKLNNYSSNQTEKTKNNTN